MAKCTNPANCAGSTSDYRSGCHEAPCRRRNAAYKKSLRMRSVSERTGVKKGRRPDGVVLPMPKSRQRPAPDILVNSDNDSSSIGPNEAACIQRLEEIGCLDVSLVARVRSAAKLLDDVDAKGAWIAANKHLHALMVYAQTGGKRKKSRGRLAVINEMTSVQRHENWPRRAGSS